MEKIKTGVNHRLTKDIRNLLKSNDQLIEKWNSLTPLARNEWICWVTIVKQEKTRQNHLKRMKGDLLAGKKRPCCWPGCPHRNLGSKKYFKE